jgi:uncharacterized protein (TIGR02996 family)
VTDEILSEIRARPDDDEPRLVLADQLTEAGDARGELITVQCALARLGPDDPRRPELELRDQELRAAHAEWAAAFRGWVEALRWERGFVVRVAAQPRRFARGAQVILAEAPLLRGLEGIGGDPQIAGAMYELAACPALRRIVELDLGSLQIGWEGVRELTRSEHIGATQRLDVSNNGLQQGDVGLFSAFGALRSLDVTGNWLGRNLGALAVPHLQELRADTTFAGDDGLAAIAASDMPIRRLSFASNRVGTAGTTALASARLPLAYLDLSSNRIGPAAVAALAASEILAGVRTLRLGHNALGDAGARTLAASPACRGIERLDLEQAGLEDLGARALVESPNLPAVVELDLSRNHLSDETRAAVRERFGAGVRF